MSSGSRLGGSSLSDELIAALLELAGAIRAETARKLDEEQRSKENSEQLLASQREMIKFQEEAVAEVRRRNDEARRHEAVCERRYLARLANESPDEIDMPLKH